MTHHTSAVSSIFGEFAPFHHHAVIYGKSPAEARCVKQSSSGASDRQAQSSGVFDTAIFSSFEVRRTLGTRQCESVCVGIATQHRSLNAIRGALSTHLGRIAPSWHA